MGMSTLSTPLITYNEQRTPGGSVVARSELGVRWIVLVLGSFLLMGSYYCYDNPSALQSQLEQQFVGTQYEESFDYYFGLLYTVYSVPNTVLPLYGGFMVDKIGIRKMLLLFTSLILIGQIVLTIGVAIKSMPLMLAGRVIFGLGGESLSVGQSTLMAVWFKDKELAFALAVNLSLGRLGSVVNDTLSPAVASASGLAASFWVGAGFCAVSVGSAVCLVCIDAAVDRRNSSGSYFNTPKVSRKGARKSPLPTSTLPYGSGSSINASSPAVSSIPVEPPVKLSDVRFFPFSFWLLCVSCVVVYGAVSPFNNIASGFLQAKYYMANATEPTAAFMDREQHQVARENHVLSSPPLDCTSVDPLLPSNHAWVVYCARKQSAISSSAAMMTIPYTISAISSPFLGFAVDRYGGIGVLSFFAPCLLVTSHLLFALSSMGPTVPMVAMGVAYSVFAAALWPGVTLVVKPSHVGTAFGTITAMQNVGLALMPIGVACIFQRWNSWETVELFFGALSTVGVLVGIAINIVDAFNGYRLNLPAFQSKQQRSQRQKGRLTPQSASSLKRPRSSSNASAKDDLAFQR
jgi:MFS family permease